MIYLGIDPGASGGLAWCNEHQQGDVIQWTTTHEMATELDNLKFSNGDRDLKAFIEAVHSFPGQGVASSFVFGRNYGEWLGILTALKISFESVTPGTWMRSLGVVGKKKDKLATYRKACELYPHWKVSRALADAVLICEYARRLGR
jgi:hypothetical protein